jgi:hypothetical protein
VRSQAPHELAAATSADIAYAVFGLLCTGLTLRPIHSIHVNFFMPYFFISLSLNILLTLIIIARVVLHSRNLRSLTGNLAASGGLYTTIVTMLIESCALYTVTFLLFVVPWFSNNNLEATFWPALTEIQVRLVPPFHDDPQCFVYFHLIMLLNRS